MVGYSRPTANALSNAVIFSTPPSSTTMKSGSSSVSRGRSECHSSTRSSSNARRPPAASRQYEWSLLSSTGFPQVSAGAVSTTLPSSGSTSTLFTRSRPSLRGTAGV